MMNKLNNVDQFSEFSLHRNSSEASPTLWSCYANTSVFIDRIRSQVLTKQDACTGVHSACRREEMCTTPSTAQAGADAGTSWSYGGGGGGLDLQIWDLNRAHETETTVFSDTTGFQHV